MVTPDVIKMDVDEDYALTKFLMYFFNSHIAKKLSRIWLLVLQGFALISRCLKSSLSLCPP